MEHPGMRRCPSCDAPPEKVHADWCDAERGISFTREQVETWVGHPLTDEEIARLEDTLPNSSFPETVATVAHEALGIDPEGC